MKLTAELALSLSELPHHINERTESRQTQRTSAPTHEGSSVARSRWLACYEFETGTSEDPSYRGRRCTLNMSRRKRPSIGVEVRRWFVSSGIVFFTGPWFKSTRPVAKNPRVAD
ncbi:hypothetical protein TNCV_182361 [Trichonephila clavipes]|nr:hypothetical protein TNCV_182361 [Trichonephila clavipes]